MKNELLTVVQWVRGCANGCPEAIYADANPRKAACCTLSALLEHCPDILAVQQTWATYVLPLVTDTEASVVEKAVDEFERPGSQRCFPRSITYLERG